MANATEVQQQPESAVPPKRDFRQEVTNQIVTMLENGTAPWQKPWNPADASLSMPNNPTTGRSYRGGNAIHLMATGLRRGYGDPRWMSYKQAAAQGWQVRHGERGTQIEFWEVKPDREEESGQERGRFIHRVYTVFNANQIDGIGEWVPKQHSSIEIVEAGERILNNSAPESPTIRSTVPSTASPRTAFTCRPGTRSTTQPHFTGLPCMNWPIIQAILRG